MRFLTISAALPLVLAAASTIELLAEPQLPAHLHEETNISQPPLIIWHGLGDKYDNEGLVEVGKLAQKTNPGTSVYIIRLGDDGSADRQATFFGNITEQLQTVCEDLATHPKLANATHLNALGFSQGGQLLRGYIERCNTPPIRALVTFGSQHNGISRFQNCAPTDWVCKGAAALLSGGTLWSDFVQNRLVPAQYFRDPEELEDYLEFSNYLADINNERKVKNATYKKNLMSLEKFVMFVFQNDTTVVPRESGWFAEVNTTSKQVTPLQERPIYKEDWLGLKELDKNGALVFKTTSGKHMQLEETVLEKTFKTYFGPTIQNIGKGDDAIPDIDELRDEDSDRTSLWEDL